MAGLKKAGSNWVDGDRFFDREAELDVLTDRVQNGTHTLLTAQRRMGKTSLVRELLRRLAADGRFETVFVDLEGVGTAADAVVEIGVESRHIQSAWDRIKSRFSNVLREVYDRVDTLAVAEVRVKLRAGIDRGNWQQKGDAICAALAKNKRPVVLAIDELPILVNRMLKDRDYRITPAGKQDADEIPELAAQERPELPRADMLHPLRQRRTGADPASSGTQCPCKHLLSPGSEALDREDRARLPCRARGDLPPRPTPRRA